MSESMQNNAETHIGDNSDNGQGLSEQVSRRVLANFSKMPTIIPESANNIRNPNY